MHFLLTAFDDGKVSYILSMPYFQIQVLTRTTAVALSYSDFPIRTVSRRAGITVLEDIQSMLS